MKKLILLVAMMFFSSMNAYAKADLNAICGGGRALISMYTCDVGPIGSGGNCILFGRDANNSGTWNSGDTFTILDSDEKSHSATYERVKSLPNVPGNSYSQCL